MNGIISMEKLRRRIVVIISVSGKIRARRHTEDWKSEELKEGQSPRGQELFVRIVCSI